MKIVEMKTSCSLSGPTESLSLQSLKLKDQKWLGYNDCSYAPHPCLIEDPSYFHLPSLIFKEKEKKREYINSLSSWKASLVYNKT